MTFNHHPIILQIALPLPLRKTFDYLLPKDFSNEQLPALGVRVAVPFGKKKLVGFLTNIAKTTQIPENKLKHATAILDPSPLFKPSLLKLFEWASHYYHHPIGEILKSSLPTNIRENQNLSKSEVFYQAYSEIPKCKLTSAQQKVIDHLQENPKGVSWLSLRTLGFQEKTLVLLEEKGWIFPSDFSEDPCSRKMPAKPYNNNPLPLQADQAKALEAIQNCQGFKTFLLDGVTGSGKTEVYMQAIAKKLTEGKQALILVPEISLTPQTIDRFQKRFSTKIAVFHSKIQNSARWIAWNETITGEARIVIGTRSAIFAPLKNTGIIIVDEEHDASFKQQAGFCYSARDLAIMRGHFENIPVILGSATPSLESFFNVHAKKFTHLTLTQRANQKPPPALYLIDIKNQKLKSGISKPLFDAIQKHLNEKNQVLIFLNRRGFSRLLLCHACGWTADCKRCSAKLVWHQLPQQLFCHHCDFHQPKPSHCPQCKSSEILMLGTGTEKIEQTLTEYFKGYPVIRIDKDSTRQKGSMEGFLEEIQEGNSQILIGTQMLAKGHHFPNLTMVAIIDADAGLYSADYKASERMGQLITQVSGRAGRGDEPGEVYIQTHHPEHPWLQTLTQKNYQTFAQQLMAERELTQLPPYYYLAVIRAESKKPEQAIDFLNSIRSKIKKYEQKRLNISPPVPAWMEKKSNLYRAILMISSPERKALHACLNELTYQLEKTPPSKVSWSLEVDPIEVL